MLLLRQQYGVQSQCNVLAFQHLCLVQDGREHRDYWISDGLYGGFNNIQVPCH